MLELFFWMVGSIFWWDEETANVAFYVMTSSEIPDMAGSDISDI